VSRAGGEGSSKDRTPRVRRRGEGRTFVPRAGGGTGASATRPELGREESGGEGWRAWPGALGLRSCSSWGSSSSAWHAAHPSALAGAGRPGGGVGELAVRCVQRRGRLRRAPENRDRGRGCWHARTPFKGLGGLGSKGRGGGGTLLRSRKFSSRAREASTPGLAVASALRAPKTEPAVFSDRSVWRATICWHTVV
jgi:hypothetical protein